MKQIVVFGGPSLPPDLRCNGYFIRPPMRRGDLVRCSPDQILVLLDGLFFQYAAVTHREILSAIDRHITVIGAASMGAQRAVELVPFGMIGCGTVYRAIVEGFVTDDSELAVGICPFTHCALTIPLIEVRRLLALAEANISQLSIAFEVAQDIHFLERTKGRLSKAWHKACPAIAKELNRVFQGGVWRLKQDDAIEAIDLALKLRNGNRSEISTGIKRQISIYADGAIENID